ncbi:hypothetical protein MJO28_001710 [Puccinia striiformis f. sp. tritici]|uniref:Uncharacterized protein n=1 Tax=Puccinia striiformis f. sp. tritici TaxID=168172 RepID=A0ACC0EVU6_9BASI|nr:hypothetical protein MJO28_001710 [Puccinia striiformis f. sp. tritici]
MVNLYNSTFMGDHAPPLFSPQQSFFPRMSGEVCKDGMDIDTVIFNYASRDKVLMVPSTGLDRVRYNEAKQQCSSWIAAEGTAHKNHSCGLCTCITYSEENNNHSVVRAVVTDGLTIGHWRCSASAAQLENLAKESGQPAPDGPCRRTLDTVRNQYCSFHQPFLEGMCQAQPCIQPALPNQRTCGLQSHRDAAQTFGTRVNSNFQLHSMLNRPGSNCTSGRRQADESDRAEESRRSGEEGASKKPSLSRARTHNDQLAVAPCGVILARQTMFNSESPSAVKVNLSCISMLLRYVPDKGLNSQLFLLDTFPTNMPQVILYESACKLLAHIYKSTSEERDRFTESIVAVDAFHFKSHKEDDCFCRKWTDPNLYPQLKKDGSWIFNSSAAEMTNIWYGGFASICRNMTAVQYNFFLDEMVRLHNIWICERLSQRPNIVHIGTISFG